MKATTRTTESASDHDPEQMSIHQMLEHINKEDASVPSAVAQAIPQIAALVTAILERLPLGGRVFYLGAGTSGRLGVLDASEIPPTYGVSDVFIGLIAGGDQAIRQSVEAAEDNLTKAWEELRQFNITPHDTVIGIAASGTTPYVVGGVKMARTKGLLTGAITCNSHSILAQAAQYPIELLTGPEFVTGSTRMKAGTAQKLALNMISTTLMIKMGRVKGNKMVNMQLTNHKLVERGVRMIVDELHIPADEARKLLLQAGSVQAAINKN
jgi:N-acetylmuramic acid 6-phosphate etherase